MASKVNNENVNDISDISNMTSALNSYYDILSHIEDKNVIFLQSHFQLFIELNKNADWGWKQEVYIETKEWKCHIVRKLVDTLKDIYYNFNSKIVIVLLKL